MLHVQKLKNIYHFFQALIANIWYGWPSRKLKVIGVTGTDGKTTTTHLIYHILKEAGKKVSMISTVYAKVGNQVYDTGLHTTTPDSFLVQKLLAQSVKAEDEYFVLETTSHALDQNRVWGIHYEVGVLTNVTHEHMDYHKNYDAYLRTKALLLGRSKKIIINSDDESYSQISNIKSQISNVKTYGLIKKADYTIDFRKQINNLADFNAYNYLCAYAAAKECGIDEKSIRKALSLFTLPPGRIDVVYKKEFTVIVDFAHTPNAIEKILETVSSVYLQKPGKIIHVFGSAGLRDTTKRFFMGQKSGQLSTLVIVTEEDYRTEDLEGICKQIAQGLEKEKFTFTHSLKKNDEKKYTIIFDRESAIKTALHLANPHDVIVITGKGHEKSLCRGTKEYPWSDSEAVRKLIAL